MESYREEMSRLEASLGGSRVKFPSELPAETHRRQVGRGGGFHRYKEGDIGWQIPYPERADQGQFGWYRGKRAFRPMGGKLF